MSNLLLTHDPETGCGRCPLSRYDMVPVCRALRRELPKDRTGDRLVSRTVGSLTVLVGAADLPAPEWCPLRAGAVVVEGKR